MRDTPSIPQDLLEYLEETYPDRSPGITTPDREIWFQAGKVSLVRHLRFTFEQQQETQLGDNPDVRQQP